MCRLAAIDAEGRAGYRAGVLAQQAGDGRGGYSKGWRFELEQADVFHVMATTRHDTVVTRWSIDHPVHDLFPGLPRQKWKRRSCGQGPMAGGSSTERASK